MLVPDCLYLQSYLHSNFLLVFVLWYSTLHFDDELSHQHFDIAFFSSDGSLPVTLPLIEILKVVHSFIVLLIITYGFYISFITNV